jgi:hypothetical protein
MVESEEGGTIQPQDAHVKKAAKSSKFEDVRQHIKEFMEATPEEHVN